MKNLLFGLILIFSSSVTLADYPVFGPDISKIFDNNAEYGCNYQYSNETYECNYPDSETIDRLIRDHNLRADDRTSMLQKSYDDKYKTLQKSADRIKDLETQYPNSNYLALLKTVYNFKEQKFVSIFALDEKLEAVSINSQVVTELQNLKTFLQQYDNLIASAETEEEKIRLENEKAREYNRTINAANSTFNLALKNLIWAKSIAEVSSYDYIDDLVKFHKFDITPLVNIHSSCIEDDDDNYIDYDPAYQEIFENIFANHTISHNSLQLFNLLDGFTHTEEKITIVCKKVPFFWPLTGPSYNKKKRALIIKWKYYWSPDILGGIFGESDPGWYATSNEFGEVMQLFEVKDED